MELAVHIPLTLRRVTGYGLRLTVARGSRGPPARRNPKELAMSAHPLPNPTLLNMFRTMVTIRRFEETIRDLFFQCEIP